MAAASINVKPEVLNWALDQVPDMKLKPELSRRLDKWRAGVLLPTFKQIELFSKITGIPPGYFFLDSPPEESFELAQFRTVDGRHLRTCLVYIQPLYAVHRPFLSEGQNTKQVLSGY